MTFDQWWNEVWMKETGSAHTRSHANAFMMQVQRTAAEKAWEAGRLMLKEEQSRAIREHELEHRKHEEFKDQKPHEKHGSSGQSHVTEKRK
jgi:hypothetical protein